MPRTYSADREELLKKQGDELVAQREESTLADCGSLLSRFSFQYGVQAGVIDAEGNTVAGVELAAIAAPGSRSGGRPSPHSRGQTFLSQQSRRITM